MKITERANQRQKTSADLIAAVLVKGLTSKPKQKSLKDITKDIPRNEKQKISFELKILTVAADFLLMAETLKLEKVKKAIFEAYVGFLMHESKNIFNHACPIIS